MHGNPVLDDYYGERRPFVQFLNLVLKKYAVAVSVCTWVSLRFGACSRTWEHADGDNVGLAGIVGLGYYYGGSSP